MFRALIVVACLMWQGMSPALAETAGEVVYTSGTVWVGTRSASDVKIGSAVAEGEQLRTGANGYLYIKLRDQGLFILRPNSKAVIAEYRLPNGKPEQARLRIELEQGVARSVSGEWVQKAKERFRVNTPIAALGVRGTDFTLFTDSRASRVSVASGGVVMGAFGPGCAAEGLGPCEGAAVAELFAGRPEIVLQVMAGKTNAELVNGRALGIHPDLIAPPTPQENRFVRPAEPPAQSSSTTPPLESVTATAVATLPAQQAGTPATPPTSSSPPGEVPASQPPEAPKPPEIPARDQRTVQWGRWVDILSTSPEEGVRKGRELIAANGQMALYRDRNTTMVMPQEGRASFKLIDHESYFLDGKTGVSTAARIENPLLSVDFGTKAFLTTFDVVGDVARTSVRSEGAILNDGTMISGGFLQSNASIRGTLSGANANEATFLYQRALEGKPLTAYGATYWRR